ncbi:YciI family protein [Poseidonibacter lekithochrous]|uniref:YciI family protein n=1 Tax=Poseidonibacter lekithochrous TaxID=1904463 RepID=UPI0008FCA833|nr:YciI family protein [Poseidonibacter lekithochrous]QKJ22640.1 YciI domain-containing protein [Poseidonibacter lekithochrous]
MFIVSLTYICDLKEVDNHLSSHVEYLEKQYEEGNFIASGRKVPRTGGIILSKLDSLEKLNKVLEKDPFYQNNLAKYDIQEFIPTMTSKDYENLKEE